MVYLGEYTHPAYIMKCGSYWPYYTPRNEVRGGILESPCPSVCLSVCPSVCRRARLGKIVRLGIGCRGGYFVPLGQPHSSWNWNYSAYSWLSKGQGTILHHFQLLLTKVYKADKQSIIHKQKLFWKIYYMTLNIKPFTVNWLLFVMYQYSPFSSVPSMTNLRTDEYKYHWPMFSSEISDSIGAFSRSRVTRRCSAMLHNFLYI